MRKTVSLVSSQVQYKTGGGGALQPEKTATGWMFCVLEVKGLYFLCNKSKGTDQLPRYQTADLRLLFFTYAKSRFSHDMAQLYLSN